MKRRFRYLLNALFIPCICIFISPAVCETARNKPSVDFSHGDLKVSENRRFLQHEDGTPFFYLGDTAWELFHRLDREDADLYLENRKGKGFTVIQAVALAEFDGLNEPNQYGEKPLTDNDPAKPNDAYFQHVDYIVNSAKEKGLYIGMLPTWGDKVRKQWGIGPVVFTEENAEAYGKFLGNRYKDQPNIIWILGGDRVADEVEGIWRAMARGIKSTGDKHLMTYHPQGGRSSAEWFHNDDWLDFNMLQSGHSHKDNLNFQKITADYNRKPVKPCLDAEPCYEDHPVNWKAENGWFDDVDARQAAYWALFAGAFGHTYGCHDIWQMKTPERAPISAARTNWKDAIDFPGAWDMMHARNLMESRPFLSRVPDPSLLVNAPKDGEGHVQATRGDGYAMIYIPHGTTVTVRLGTIPGEKVKVYWFDPRTGTSYENAILMNMGTHEFDPAGEPGRGNDWVLVLDDASKDFPPPGKPLFE